MEIIEKTIRKRYSVRINFQFFSITTTIENSSNTKVTATTTALLETTEKLPIKQDESYEMQTAKLLKREREHQIQETAYIT